MLSLKMVNSFKNGDRKNIRGFNDNRTTLLPNDSVGAIAGRTAFCFGSRHMVAGMRGFHSVITRSGKLKAEILYRQYC